jgi:hypothetical protein
MGISFNVEFELVIVFLLPMTPHPPSGLSPIVPILRSDRQTQENWHTGDPIRLYEPHSPTVSYSLRAITPVTRTANSLCRQPTTRSTRTSQPTNYHPAESLRATETTRSQLSANECRDRISLVDSQTSQRRVRLTRTHVFSLTIPLKTTTWTPI